MYMGVLGDKFYENLVKNVVLWPLSRWTDGIKCRMFKDKPIVFVISQGRIKEERENDWNKKKIQEMKRKRLRLEEWRNGKEK